MENSKFKDELSHYKETIDIRDYLERTGYILDKSRDTPRYKAYTNQELGDKVYIPKNNKTGIANFYVNQHDNDDKGTLVDFVMSREKKTLDEARLTLREFQHGYVPVQQKQPVTEINEQDKKKRQQFIVHKIATTHPSGLDDVYLEKRLLTTDTRHHPAFAGKIKLNEVADEKWMVFPLEDEQGKPTGLAMKRDGKEKILGEKSGVWLSQPTIKDRTVDKLILTEHPIDAMSYHQLHNKKLNGQNVVYVATAGNPSEKQMNLIQKKIQTLQPKEVVLANDNDQAGRQYNEKYQHKLKDNGIPLNIEKPQFKDWNADVYAGALHQARLLDRTIEDPHKVQLAGKQKVGQEMEEMLEQKNYTKLSENSHQNLPSYYVERSIAGKQVEFSLKEVAQINNDQKLADWLKSPVQEKEINAGYVAEKSQTVADSVVLNKEQEKAMLSPERPLVAEKRIDQINAQTKKGVQAFQDADSYIKTQVTSIPQSAMSQQEHTSIGTSDGFLETQRRYNQQIDILQQQIAGNPAHEQMSRKLYYYKNYPHLNDQEVDTYLSVEDKMKGQQQEHGQGIGRQKDREIGI